MATTAEKKAWLEKQPARTCIGPYTEENGWVGTCKEDLNPILAEIPEDGESHDFECPGCGAPHHATRTPAE